MKRKHHQPAKSSQPANSSLTFKEHLTELRKRVVYVAISLAFWSVLTYAFEQKTINALLRPARHQQFIYTSPIGGVDFVFRVSLYIAAILSTPVIVYNLLAFIEPLLTKSSRRFIAFGSAAAGLLAGCGLVFGYFVGLPSAMHFLLHQFVTSQIKPLLTIQAYLGFVMVYMLGSALMLQIPLILLFINRIKPLKPSKLLHYERWVILGSFVMSGIMNPTPNLMDQLLVAGPLIIMYQLGILIIALVNRGQKVKTEQIEETVAAAVPASAPVRASQPQFQPQPVRAQQRLATKPRSKSFDVIVPGAMHGKVGNSYSKPHLFEKEPAGSSFKKASVQMSDVKPRPRKYINGFIEERGSRVSNPYSL